MFFTLYYFNFHRKVPPLLVEKLSPKESFFQNIFCSFKKPPYICIIKLNN